MAFEIKQQFKLSQQLHMTPMLKQAISLLLFSRQELVEAVQRELLENPFLEERETDNAASSAPDAAADSAKAPNRTAPGLRKKWPAAPNGKNISANFPVSRAWLSRNSRPPKRTAIPSKPATPPNPTSKPISWDSFCSPPLTEKQKSIGECIIGNLDETGYLTATDEEIASLAGADPSEVPPVLSAIQNFDPVGVAARSLSECLLIQLHARRDDRDPILVDLVQNHLEDLEKQRYKPLLRHFHIDLDTLKEYIGIIQSLEPRPRRQPRQQHALLRQPRHLRAQGERRIRHPHERRRPAPPPAFPPLRRARREKPLQREKDYMNDRLRSAVWIIRSLEERQRTLYQVMESIVKHQHDFFEYGVYKLKPLVLKDIAKTSAAANPA